MPGRPRLQGEKRAEAAPLGAWVREICKTDMSYLTNCARQVRPPSGPSITVTARSVWSRVPSRQGRSSTSRYKVSDYVDYDEDRCFILPPCIAYVRIYMLTTASCTL